MPRHRSKLPVLRKPKSVEDSLALVPVGVNETDAQGGFIEAQSTIQSSKELEDELRAVGLKIKQHENNINLLKSKIIKLDDTILTMQDIIEKHQSLSTPKISQGDSSHPTSEEEINEHILQHENTAAGILCRLKTRHGAQASSIALIKDVVGVVATLGKVEDDNFSRLLSEYLGMETMLAIVCKTYEGVKALEIYNEEGSINKSSGLHGLSASIGRPLDDRFLVICLESLRPYSGKFVLDDPQRKLDILNPRLANGQYPPGFLGFAVNMIYIDGSNLFCVTPSGHGLRETLFYNLFSRLQVYRTRTEMMQALPCINDGAISLDGGIIRTDGVFSLGNREEVNVRFPRPVVPDSYNSTEGQIKDLKLKKDRILADMTREQTLLDDCRFTFNKKKSEYLKFLVQSQTNPIPKK